MGKQPGTCDEADQLVVTLDPDTNVPLRDVAWRLQRPLQKAVCVLESALRHMKVVQKPAQYVKTSKWHKQLLVLHSLVAVMVSTVSWAHCMLIICHRH